METAEQPAKSREIQLLESIDRGVGTIRYWVQLWSWLSVIVILVTIFVVFTAPNPPDLMKILRHD